MGCIKPPLNVTDPPPRTANRLAFTLGSAAIDAAARGQTSRQARFPEARQAVQRATREMNEATTIAEVDKALETARAALETALTRAKASAEKQSLNARLQNVSQTASEHRGRIQLRECLDAGFPRHIVTASATSTPHELAMGYALVGSKPRSSEHAGSRFPTSLLDTRIATKYPDSVQFTPQGFPDFSPYAIASVTLDDLTGSRTRDFKLADEKAGFAKTPSGYTWHHTEDGQTLVLVPTELHEAVPHTGGVARDQNMKGLQATFTIGALGFIMSSTTTERP